MRVVNRANLSDDAVADIAAQLSGQENLKDVMSWALSAQPGTFLPSVVADVIVQDEFTHDVIVPWREWKSRNGTTIYSRPYCAE